jgi:DNA polymerase III delta prime subunit
METLESITEGDLRRATMLLQSVARLSLQQSQITTEHIIEISGVS